MNNVLFLLLYIVVFYVCLTLHRFFKAGKNNAAQFSHLEKAWQMDNDPVADEIVTVGPDHATRQQVEIVGLSQMPGGLPVPLSRHKAKFHN
jgi:hypothetical protein